MSGGNNILILLSIPVHEHELSFHLFSTLLFYGPCRVPNRYLYNPLYSFINLYVCILFWVWSGSYIVLNLRFYLLTLIFLKAMNIYVLTRYPMTLQFKRIFVNKIFLYQWLLCPLQIKIAFCLLSPHKINASNKKSISKKNIWNSFNSRLKDHHNKWTWLKHFVNSSL